MTEHDHHAVHQLLDALDALYEAQLSPRQLRTLLLETKLDSAELAAEVNEVARALEGVLSLDTRIKPPYDERYETALSSTATLRSLLADVVDEAAHRSRR
ncbi:MAG TPA: hypothetical protein VFX59_26705 [Polyangiales bacterium]|nr:hypothetical protein [Polyangiales bacterium]